MRCILLLLSLLLGFPGFAAADWYGAGHGRAPVGLRVYICHGYGCRIVTPVQFSQAELRAIAAPLLHGVNSAAKERAALSRADQTYEKIVGRHVGTGHDLARTQIGDAAADQMDCIDEATNTTSLLTMLAGQGLLRHHAVGEPAARGFFLDGRYPHATAVVHENGGDDWAVDSWPRANGQPPVIEPLSNWYGSWNDGTSQ
jgi:hypothetical protein